VIDDLLGLFEVGDSSQQLVYLAVGIVLLKTFREFLQFADLGEQVVDVGVQLLNHVAN
jgi:hypothetical protein